MNMIIYDWQYMEPMFWVQTIVIDGSAFLFDLGSCNDVIVTSELPPQARGSPFE